MAGVLALGECLYCSLAQVSYWIGNAILVEGIRFRSRSEASLASQPRVYKLSLQIVAETAEGIGRHAAKQGIYASSGSGGSND